MDSVGKIVLSGDGYDSKRVVGVTLPAAAWDFLEMEADVRMKNLSAHVSDMLLTALQVQGYKPRREMLSPAQQAKMEVCNGC